MKSATIALAIVAALLGSTAASSQTIIKRTCVGRMCQVTIGEAGPGLGKTIDIPMAQDEDRTARIEKWESYCHPQIFVDDLGVSRYRYAHAGCSSGRSE